LNPRSSDHDEAFGHHLDPAESLPATARNFPDFLPHIPSPKSPSIHNLAVENPFANDANGTLIHPALHRVRDRRSLDNAIVVDGFIKGRFHFASSASGTRRLRQLGQDQHSAASPFHHPLDPNEILAAPCALPPSYGDVSKLNQLDRKLWEFCESLVQLAPLQISFCMANKCTYQSSKAFATAERWSIVTTRILNR
jgi:hypothetical protein